MIKDLVVVNDSGYRRVGVWRFFYQVQILFVCHSQRSLEGVDSLLYIVAYKAHLMHTADTIVNAVGHFFFYSPAEGAFG